MDSFTIARDFFLMFYVQCHKHARKQETLEGSMESIKYLF